MLTRSLRVTTLVAAISLAPAAALATTTVLYDSTLNTLPTAQGWVYGEDIPGGGAQSMAAPNPIALLDTTANINTRAGWGHAGPVMDTSVGYTLHFTSAITSETHTSNDRAGFDVLMISHDATKALELAFWPDRVFALNNDVPTFSHGEEALLPSLPTPFHNYALSVSGNSYTLFDGTSPILSGSLRDYTASAATVPGTPFHVYQIADALFFGDDTTSAKGITELKSVSFVNVVETPEPASLSLLALGGLACLHRRR